MQGCAACGAEGGWDAAAAHADGGDKAAAGSGDRLCKRSHWMPCAGCRSGFGQPSQASEAPCPCLPFAFVSQCPCIWVSPFPPVLAQRHNPWPGWAVVANCDQGLGPSHCHMRVHCKMCSPLPVRSCRPSNHMRAEPSCV